jgi:hypothetical protein
MNQPGVTIWPPLETAYTDEFGEIDPEVYATAGRLWTQGERFALHALVDAPGGLRLMLRAAAIVTRRLSLPDVRIANLPAYLFQIYKHLVLAELEKQSGHRKREVDRRTELEALSFPLAEDIDRKILIQQIMRRMDSRMCEVFELLILGHSFEEIGRLRGQNGHALRTGFHKQLKRLTKEIQAGQSSGR